MFNGWIVGNGSIKLQSIFTWRHGGHIGVAKQRNDGHVSVPRFTNPVGIELFSYVNAFFSSNKFAYFKKRCVRSRCLCSYLLLILKPCYNYHWICASSHGTLKFGDKSNFLTFFLKMPIQRFSPYWSTVISEKCVVTPVFFFGKNTSQ